MRINIIFLLLLTLSSRAAFAGSCQGRFINPITDICWSCILPISIGNLAKFGKGNTPKKRDNPGPKNLICKCDSRLGITIGFWEPVRLIDVTRKPYCLVNLGGIQLKSNPKKNTSFAPGRGKRATKHSFYHVHYYLYPLIYWLELLTDFMCLEDGSFDLGYLSELDVTWNDHKLQTLFNPDVYLFANPISVAACSVDCVSATASTAMDSMFWCAGCWGSFYPLSGANADFDGGVRNASLLALRILARMHRVGLARQTATTDDAWDGELCRKSYAARLPKSQYKLQLTYPKSTKGQVGCWPLGLSSSWYQSFNEYPYEGEDWGFLLWRKKNCCFL